MSVITTNLTSGVDGTQATTRTTASVAPTANRLVLLGVFNKCLSGTANTPTVTGAGMTWVQIATQNNSTDTTLRATLFRAMSASPGSGALTIDFGGQNTFNANWSVDQAAGVVVTGSNGADAVVQSASNEASSTSVTATLGAFGNNSNATYGFCGAYGGSGTLITKGGSFTELSNTSNSSMGEAQWASTPQTSVNWTNNATTVMIGIGIELKAVLSGGAAILAM